MKSFVDIIYSEINIPWGSEAFNKLILMSGTKISRFR